MERFWCYLVGFVVALVLVAGFLIVKIVAEEQKAKGERRVKQLAEVVFCEELQKVMGYYPCTLGAWTNASTTDWQKRRESMRLLNYNELKTLLLEEQGKIPLAVPGARYEMNIPQPNKHGESVRAGIRIALRCMERCQPVLPDEVRTHGAWITQNSGYTKFQCSACGSKNHDICWPFCCKCGAEMDLPLVKFSAKTEKKEEGEHETD